MRIATNNIGSMVALVVSRNTCREIGSAKGWSFVGSEGSIRFSKRARSTTVIPVELWSMRHQLRCDNITPSPRAYVVHTYTLRTYIAVLAARVDETTPWLGSNVAKYRWTRGLAFRIISNMSPSWRWCQAAQYYSNGLSYNTRHCVNLLRVQG